MRFSRRVTEPTAAEQLRHVEDRLHIISALAIALGEPGLLAQVLFESDDPEDARVHLQEMFHLDEVQARAVLAAQFRQATRLQVARILDERDELLEELRRLQDQGHAES